MKAISDNDFIIRRKNRDYQGLAVYFFRIFAILPKKNKERIKAENQWDSLTKKEQNAIEES